MRILHTGDWHLGRTLEGRSRQEEQEAFIDELVAIVSDQRIDLILMAGDVYDSVNPPAAAEKLFYEACARLTAQGTQLVIIAGNHDQPERVAAASPLVAEQGISLIGLPIQAPIHVKVSRSHEEAIIAALPYPSESRLSELLSLDEDEQNLRIQYSAKVGKLMTQMAQQFRRDTVNLAMSHIYVLGGLESDSERPIQVGGAYTVSPSELNIGAQYTALGHLHRPQLVKGESLIRYSGSPLSYSFSEAGQTKSVMILDVAPDKPPILEEVYLSCGRPLVKWKCQGGLEEVHSWLREGRDQHAFIDLEIKLNEAMALGDIQELRKAHSGIIHIRPIYQEQGDELSLTERTSLPLSEMFSHFYRRQHGGAEPEAELVDLFMSLVEEDKGSLDSDTTIASEMSMVSEGDE